MYLRLFALLLAFAFLLNPTRAIFADTTTETGEAAMSETEGSTDVESPNDEADATDESTTRADEDESDAVPAEADEVASNGDEVEEEISLEIDEPLQVTPGNEGLAELDRATQLKVTAEGLSDLNDVIDKLDSAMEKGLDKDNQTFAEQLMIATLLQRAQTLSAAILDRPVQDPRWMQVRQFALTDLHRALEFETDLPEAQLLIGRLQILPLGDPNAAKRAFTKVIKSSLATPEQKAQSLALRGALPGEEKDKAADFDKAVELMPTKPDYYRVRAQFRYSSDNLEGALEDVDKALELQPDDAGTIELRGLILLGLDRSDEALAAFNKAGELAPEAVLPYQHRGEVYRRQGDLEKSVEQLSKALELAPDDTGTLLLRATVYYQLDDAENALEDIETVLKKQPQLLMAHLLRAEIYASTDRIDQAIEQLERLVAIAPDQLRLLDPLGRYYLIAGRPRKCIETFSKVLEVEPENYVALRFRGDAYLNIGKHKEAIEDFDRAVALTEEDDGLLNNFAWVLATSPDDDVRDGERSIELARKAAEKTSYHVPHILSTLAAAYAETGNFDEAKKWSQKAVEVCQTDIDNAKSDDARKRAEADLVNLKKELQSYEEGKPVRERQTLEDAAPKPQPQASTSTFAPSSAAPAPARTLDF